MRIQGVEVPVTNCPSCETGRIIWNGNQNDYYFTCSRCEWETGRGGEIPTKGLKGLVGVAIYGGKVIVPKPTPKKKHKPAPVVEFQPDSPQLVQAIREECERKMKILIAERKKFPPTNIEKVVKKKTVLVPNPKFTEKMRRHMHTFYVDAQEIRAELIEKGLR